MLAALDKPSSDDEGVPVAALHRRLIGRKQVGSKGRAKKKVEPLSIRSPSRHQQGVFPNGLCWYHHALKVHLHEIFLFSFFALIKHI